MPRVPGRNARGMPKGRPRAEPPLLSTGGCEPCGYFTNSMSRYVGSGQ